MAYMKTTTYTSGVNILASEVGLVLKTFEGKRQFVRFMELLHGEKDGE